jgi:hypothetical protein
LSVDGQHFTDDVNVTRFKQLLPKDPSVGREKDLVQFFTDRGLRTVSVASLRPYVRRKRKPKVSASTDDE